MDEPVCIENLIAEKDVNSNNEAFSWWNLSQDACEKSATNHKEIYVPDFSSTSVSRNDSAYKNHTVSKDHHGCQFLFNGHEKTTKGQKISSVSIWDVSEFDLKQIENGKSIVDKLIAVISASLKKLRLPREKHTVLGYFCFPCLFDTRDETKWNIHMESLTHLSSALTFNENCQEYKCDCKILIYCDEAFRESHLSSSSHVTLKMLYDEKTKNTTRTKLVEYTIDLINEKFRNIKKKKKKSVNKAIAHKNSIEFSCDVTEPDYRTKDLEKICNRISNELKKDPIAYLLKAMLRYFCYPCREFVTETSWRKHLSLTTHQNNCVKTVCDIRECECRIVFYCDEISYKDHKLSQFHGDLITEISKYPVVYKLFPEKTSNISIESDNRIYGSLNNYLKKIHNKLKGNDLMLNKSVIGYFCGPCMYGETDERKWIAHKRRHITQPATFKNCLKFQCSCQILIYGEKTLFAKHINSQAHSKLMLLLRSKPDFIECCKILEAPIAKWKKIDEDEAEIIFTTISKGLQEDALARVLNKEMFQYYCYPCATHVISEVNWRKHLINSIHINKCLDTFNEEHHCDCQIVFFCDEIFYDAHIHSQLHSDLITKISKYPVVSKFLLMQDSTVPSNSTISEQGYEMLNNFLQFIIRVASINRSLSNTSIIGYYCYPCFYGTKNIHNWNEHVRDTRAHKTQTASFKNCFTFKCSCEILIYGDKTLIAKHINSKIHSRLLAKLLFSKSNFKGCCEILNSPVRKGCIKMKKNIGKNYNNFYDAKIKKRLKMIPQRNLSRKRSASKRRKRQTKPEKIVGLSACVSASKRKKRQIKPEKIVGLSACVSAHMLKYHKTPGIVVSPWSRIIRKKENLKFRGCRSNLFYLEHDVLDEWFPEKERLPYERRKRTYRKRPWVNLMRQTAMLGLKSVYKPTGKKTKPKKKEVEEPTSKKTLLKKKKKQEKPTKAKETTKTDEPLVKNVKKIEKTSSENIKKKRKVRKKKNSKRV